MNANFPRLEDSSNGALVPRGQSPTALDHWRDDTSESGGFSPRRIWAALVRRKWVLVLCALLGAGAAYIVYGRIELEYMARGSVWINSGNTRTTMGQPITQGELLSETAWIDLLRSYAVFDPVVLQERLFLDAPAEDSALFADFSLDDRFRAGPYVLTIADDGRGWELTSKAAGDLDETGLAGDPIGASLGFRWKPPVEAFRPGAEIEFRVVAPRDAATDLFLRLQSPMDRGGNYITLLLPGRDPEKITRILRAIMTHYVELAQNLKARDLVDRTAILARQVDTIRFQLESATAELESFKVQTITLPTDESGPVAPGLRQTQGPVFTQFFSRRLELDDMRRDYDNLSRLVGRLPMPPGELDVASFQLIPAVAQSSELSAALSNLISERAKLRELEERYTPEYADVQDEVERIATLERQRIPSLARDLLDRLAEQMQQSQDLLDTRAAEMRDIPARTIKEAELEREVARLAGVFNDLQNRYETGKLAAEATIADVRILDEPRVPQRPFRDDRRRWAAIAFLAIFGTGVAGVILLDRFDPRIRYPLQVQDDLGIEILGAIPRIRIRGKVNTGEVTEAFREIRMRLEFAYGNAKPLIVAVTSPDSGEGKTLVCANLAIAFSQLRKKTLLIDADTRRGDVHELLEMDRKPGLTEALRGLTNGSVVRQTSHPFLHFVGSGSRISSSPELLSGSRMQDLMALAKQRFEVILIDCPPMAAGGDAFVLSAHAGAVLFVMRSGSTHKELARAKMEAFYRLPVRILGAVLNDVTDDGSHGGYRYYSYYLPGYRAGDEEQEEVDPEPVTL